MSPCGRSTDPYYPKLTRINMDLVLLTCLACGFFWSHTMWIRTVAGNRLTDNYNPLSETLKDTPAAAVAALARNVRWAGRRRHKRALSPQVNEIDQEAEPEAPTTAEGGESEVLFEGDILGVDPASISEDQLAKQANFITDESKKWADGVVPYRISKKFSSSDRAVIMAAMDDFTRQTGVRFVRKSKQDRDFLSIVVSFGGCSSYVGRQGDKQEVRLQVPGCLTKRGTIQHELMHSIGFYHEQARTDRDDYVDVNMENIAPADRGNFLRYTSNALGQPYDFGSVMHYGWNWFALDDSQYTMRIRPALAKPGVQLGQRESLSPIDVKKVRLAYAAGAEAACPKEPGWMFIQGKRRQECYFFSFLSSEGPKSFTAAKRYCGAHGSHLAPASSRRTIGKVVLEHPDRVNADDELWLHKCRFFRADDLQGYDEGGCTGRTLDFVCVARQGRTIDDTS